MRLTPVSSMLPTLSAEFTADSTSSVIPFLSSAAKSKVSDSRPKAIGSVVFAFTVTPSGRIDSIEVAIASRLVVVSLGRIFSLMRSAVTDNRLWALETTVDAVIRSSKRSTFLAAPDNNSATFRA